MECNAHTLPPSLSKSGLPVKRALCSDTFASFPHNLQHSDHKSLLGLYKRFICTSQESPLKFLKLLLGASGLGHLEDVEAHRLAERPALAYSHDVPNLNVPGSKRRATLSRQFCTECRKGLTRESHLHSSTFTSPPWQPNC